MQSDPVRQLELLWALLHQEVPANCHRLNLVFNINTTWLRLIMVLWDSMASPRIKIIDLSPLCTQGLYSPIQQQHMDNLNLKCSKECMLLIRIYHHNRYVILIILCWH